MRWRCQSCPRTWDDYANEQDFAGEVWGSAETIPASGVEPYTPRYFHTQSDGGNGAQATCGPVVPDPEPHTYRASSENHVSCTECPASFLAGQHIGADYFSRARVVGVDVTAAVVEDRAETVPAAEFDALEAALDELPHRRPYDWRFVPQYGTLTGGRLWHVFVPARCHPEDPGAGVGVPRPPRYDVRLVTLCDSGWTGTAVEGAPRATRPDDLVCENCDSLRTGRLPSPDPALQHAPPSRATPGRYRCRGCGAIDPEAGVHANGLRLHHIRDEAWAHNRHRSSLCGPVVEDPDPDKLEPPTIEEAFGHVRAALDRALPREHADRVLDVLEPKKAQWEAMREILLALGYRGTVDEERAERARDAILRYYNEHRSSAFQVIHDHARSGLELAVEGRRGDDPDSLFYRIINRLTAIENAAYNELGKPRGDG